MTRTVERAKFGLAQARSGFNFENARAQCADLDILKVHKELFSSLARAIVYIVRSFLHSQSVVEHNQLSVKK